MNKNKSRFYIVLAAVLVAFCVIALAVPFVKNTVYWLSFAFAVLAIALQLYAMPKAMAGDAKSKFYGFPILRVSFIYLAAQLMLSLAFMALAKLLPVWVPVVLYVLLLCAALVGFVAADTARNEVERQDVKIEKQVTVMRTLQSKAASLVGLCQSESAKKAVSAFAEELRFSDPVSNNLLAEADTLLASRVSSLQQALEDGDEAAILAACRKASLTLAERNRLCMLTKNK